MGVWTDTKDNNKTIYIWLVEITVQTSELNRLFEYRIVTNINMIICQYKFTNIFKEVSV